MIENSLERIIPDFLEQTESADRETLQIHLERYRFAAKHLLPGTVGDIACGVGYGSALLLQLRTADISRIFAVDADRDVIAYARQRYSNEKIVFECSDALEYEPPELLNNIVSLETIEHLSDPEKFIRVQSSRLAPSGYFIASVPITPSVDINPWHLNDFTPLSFIRLFKSCGFEVVEKMVQEQSFNPFKILGKKGKRLEGVRKNLMEYYVRNPGKLFLRIRSLLTDGFRNKYLVVVFRKL